VWVQASYLIAVGALLAGGLALHRARLPEWARRGGTWLLALAGAAFTWRISDPIDPLLYADFVKAYRWAGSQALLRPDWLYPGTGEELRFVNLPIVALLFAPLAELDPRTGARLLTAFGWAALAAGFCLLSRLAGLEGRTRALVAIALASNGPLHNSLRLGNTTELALPLLAGALLCLARGREAAGGALLAAAGILKLPLLVAGGWLLARARWRALVAFSATGLAVLGLSLLLFGPAPHRDWYRACIEPFFGHAIAAYNVQSIDGWLARLRADADPLGWSLVALDPAARAARAVLIGALAAACAAVCWRAGRPRGAADASLELAICLCFALVASPISWSHYYLLAWIGVALLLGDRGAGARGPLLLAAALVSLPVVRPAPALVATPALRLLVSLHLAGGVLLLALLLRRRAERGPPLEQGREAAAQRAEGSERSASG
jgi:hypothetical protein